MGDLLEAERATESAEAASTGRKRDRSTIDFPYTDLERAVDLTGTLQREGGQTRISQVQLAVAMDQSATGGTFRGRLSAAKMFGLVDTEQGMVWLTPLGLRAIDDATAVAAKAEAFLNIPLYKAMYERLNGYALPPAAAIERQMEALGVPPKQKERARQAFSSSATYASYIASNGRFSRPLIAAKPPPLEEIAPQDGSIGGGGGSGGGAGGGDGGGGATRDDPKLHASLRGLVSELPEAKSEWTIEDQADWLMAAAQLFKVVYKAKGRIEVKIVQPRNDNGSPT